VARSRSYASGSPSPGGGSGPSDSTPVLKFLNRTFTVCRGTAVNARGDRTNVGVPLYTGVQASLAESAPPQTGDRASQVRRTIREFTAVFSNWADIQDDDTLMDEATGQFYMVITQQARPGPGYYPAQKVVTLRERTGVTIKSDEGG
jgi:hypothetical protein